MTATNTISTTEKIAKGWYVVMSLQFASVFSLNCFPNQTGCRNP